MKLNFLSALLGLLFIYSISNSQSLPNHSIRINHFELQTTPNLQEFNALRAVYAADAVDDFFYAWIQFDKLPDSKTRENITAQTGIYFLGYLPENSYYAKIPVAVDVAPLYTFAVRGIYRILPDYKLSPQLTGGELPAYALNEDQSINLNIEYFKSLNQQEIIDRFAALQIIATAKAPFVNVVTVTIPIAVIHDLAALPFVQYVEPVGPKGEPENYESRTDHRNNFIANDYASGLHYDGTGVWVGMNDDGQIGPHIDFQGRLNQDFVLNDDQGSHGDHVAGIIMGGGNLDPKKRGNAFGANLMVYTAYNGSTPEYEGFYDVPNSYTEPGVKINSTSYSDGCNVGYTTLTQTIDETMVDYPEFMHVFSSGNSSSSGCNGLGGKFYQITGGHKMGKNCLTVGNVDKEDVLNGTSSGGPAKDGRLKPEICAVGTDVSSTQPNNTYTLMSGTSMACPGISGNFAMLIHAYRGLNGGVTPPSALIKSAMMNTADDLGNPGPDFQYGYGRVNARRAYNLLSDHHYFNSSAEQSSEETFSLDVPEGTAQVRVMLYWHDAVASIGAPKDLVNDLQLLVTDPGGNSYDPWILNPLSNKDTLDLPAHRGIDTLNNHEQVTIDNPVAGSYTITIRGLSVPEGPQPYDVVYEFLNDEITLTYPTGGEPWVPGETEKVRWDSYGGIGTFLLELSPDGGVSWSTVNAAIDASQRYYDFTIPSAQAPSGNYLMRISRGSVTDMSDTTFSIIGVPQNLSITGICPDTVNISWTAVASATSYEVYVLGSQYMESVGTTTLTNYAIPSLDINNEDWISVRALGPQGANGRRAIAIHKPTGLLSCVFTNDAAITQINSPASVYSSCMDIGSVSVSTTIQNTGVTALASIPVNMQTDGGAVITETYSGTIAPGDSVIFTFSATVDLSTTGNHTVKTWLSLPTDQNSGNDTLTQLISVMAGTSVAYPVYENFETFDLCETQNDCEAGICALSDGWINATNLTGDDIDWRTNAGPTPGNNTGPDVDFEPGTASGKYIYLEAGGGCKNKTALLLSPCIDLSAAVAPKLTFASHLYGSNTGELHVDVFVNNEWTMDIITPISGDQGNQWNPDTADLAAFAGQVITIRFRGITGNGASSDMALDAIGINDFLSGVNALFTSSGSLCVDSVITFTSTSAGDINAYEWNFGAGATPSTAFTAGPHEVVYTSPGIKTVTLTVTGGSNTDTESQNITIVDHPDAQFTYSATDLTFTFSNTSTNADSYSWDFGDGSTSSDTSPSHTFAGAGVYVVTLTVTGPCGTSVVSQTIVITGISSPGSVSGISVFPNPSDGIFNASFYGEAAHASAVSICDLAGRKLFDLPANEWVNSHVFQVDLSKYAAGIYFLKVNSEEKEWNIKLMR